MDGDWTHWHRLQDERQERITVDRSRMACTDPVDGGVGGDKACGVQREADRLHRRRSLPSADKQLGCYGDDQRSCASCDWIDLRHISEAVRANKKQLLACMNNDRRRKV